MIFWILAAPLFAVILILLLRPLFMAARRKGLAPQEVYKAQLAEIDREAEAGLISSEDAHAARTEISRRILRSGEGAGPVAASLKDPRIAAVIIVVGLVGLTLAVYLTIGRPGLPGQPYAARDIEIESAEQIGPAVEEFERRLAALEDPADQALMIGDAYASLGALDEAENAYLNALALRPEDADVLTRVAEVAIMRSGGQLTDDGLAFIDEALAQDPSHPAANFYRALRDYQQGDYAFAILRLDDLLAMAPEGADWTAQVEGLREEARMASQQVENFAEMEDADREAMVRGMVDGLAARLETAPNDFEGWLRLANAYAVLGEQPLALEALLRAEALAEGEPVLERRVQEVADQIGTH